MYNNKKIRPTCRQTSHIPKRTRSFPSSRTSSWFVWWKNKNWVIKFCRQLWLKPFKKTWNSFKITKNLSTTTTTSHAKLILSLQIWLSCVMNSQSTIKIIALSSGYWSIGPSVIWIVLLIKKLWINTRTMNSNTPRKFSLRKWEAMSRKWLNISPYVRFRK